VQGITRALITDKGIAQQEYIKEKYFFHSCFDNKKRPQARAFLFFL
jgi:hypothetical protein